MNFKRFMFTLRLRYIEFKYRKDPRTKINLKEGNDLLQLLDPSMFKDIDRSNTQGYFLRTLYPNIEDYLAKLHEVNRVLSMDGDLNLDTLYKGDAYNRPMIKFFVSRDHYYIDIATELEKFRTQALRYYSLIDKLQEDEYGKNAYHWRILSKLTLNIKDVTHQVCSLVI